MHLQYVREKFSQHTAPPTPSVSLYITLYVFDDGGHEPAMPTHYALKFSKRARETERERERERERLIHDVKPSIDIAVLG